MMNDEMTRDEVLAKYNELCKAVAELAKVYHGHSLPMPPLGVVERVTRKLDEIEKDRVKLNAKFDRIFNIITGEDDQ